MCYDCGRYLHYFVTFLLDKMIPIWYLYGGKRKGAISMIRILTGLIIVFMFMVFLAGGIAYAYSPPTYGSGVYDYRDSQKKPLKGPGHNDLRGQRHIDFRGVEEDLLEDLRVPITPYNKKFEHIKERRTEHESYN
jgi:hypothetical protein